MTIVDLDPQQLAGDLIYRYLSVQYHCQHLVQSDWQDMDEVNLIEMMDDLTAMMSAFGMYMRDLGELASGRSHSHPEKSEPIQLSKELYDIARRVHHTIKHKHCPPPFGKSLAWQEFCELVTQIAEEQPVFGRSRDYSLSRNDQIGKMIALAHVT